jgi:hypothetical protein
MEQMEPWLEPVHHRNAAETEFRIGKLDRGSVSRVDLVLSFGSFVIS